MMYPLFGFVITISLAATSTGVSQQSPAAAVTYQGRSRQDAQALSGHTDLTLTAVPTPSTTALSGCGWTTGPVYPIPVLDNGATKIGALLYSFGGASNNVAIASSYKFDGANWTSIAPLPEALEKPAVASDGTFAYIMGGATNTVGAIRKTLYRYNAGTNTYTTLAPSSVATWNSAGVFLNGKLYKIGGFIDSGFTPTNAVEVYNIAANTWAPAASYPVSLGWFSAFARNGFVYGAGGVDSSDVASSKTYRYDPGANTWSDAAIADLPAPRWGAAYVSYYGAPVLAGGYVGIGTGSIATSVIGWDAASNTWSDLPDMLQPRARTTGAVLNGSLFVIGGRPLTNEFIGTDDNQQLTCLAPSFTVTTVADHDDGVCDVTDCTLREAINAANILASDEPTLVTFAPSVIGTIQLTAVLPSLSGNIDMQGPGANLLTIRRDTGGAYRIFNITPASTVVRIAGLTIAKGSTSSGGGIFTVGALTLTNVTLSGNAATNGGGLFSNFATVNITGSTISGNTVSNAIFAGSGGGIFNSGGVLNLINTTVSGNTAIGPGGNSDSGGGIITNVGSVTLLNSTISRNSGDLGGGIRNINGGTVTARNTIIALNTSPSGPDFNGPLTSQGFNFIGKNTGATITPAQPSDHIGTAGAPLDPLLGPLQNNGGPTMTLALLQNSPVIDAGDSANFSATDQRGVLRPIDGDGDSNAVPDIGAFEYVPPPVTVWRSVRPHTDAGPLPIVLNPAASGNGLAGPTVESRQGGVQLVEVAFNYPITLANPGAITVTGQSTIDGILQPPVSYEVTPALATSTTLALTFPSLLPDATCYTISVAGALQDPLGQPTPDDPDCMVRALYGDATGSGDVNLGDAILINARLSAVLATSPQLDVDLSGAIELQDALLAKTVISSPAQQALCP